MNDTSSMIDSDIHQPKLVGRNSLSQCPVVYNAYQ